MHTRRLKDTEFQATFGERMHNVTDAGDAACEVWPYVHAIPETDLDGFEYIRDEVGSVYRADSGEFDHVLIPTRTKNVYLVIVVNRKEGEVMGHHVLNLNEKYGLRTPRAD